ncbi:MAG: hydrogenase subunit MbhD domain-containing protein [Lachnospiraceae bacterium]|jgi:energy-converting hydrogenase B subunit D
MIDSLFSLNTLVILGIVVSAVLAVVCDKMLSAVIALGVTGAFMTLEFILLHAPDVALSEAAVGAVLSTVLFVIAIKKTTKKESEEQ